jgi:hypothetical protein
MNLMKSSAVFVIAIVLAGGIFNQANASTKPVPQSGSDIVVVNQDLSALSASARLDKKTVNGMTVVTQTPNLTPLNKTTVNGMTVVMQPTDVGGGFKPAGTTTTSNVPPAADAKKKAESPFDIQAQQRKQQQGAVAGAAVGSAAASALGVKSAGGRAAISAVGSAAGAMMAGGTKGNGGVIVGGALGTAAGEGVASALKVKNPALRTAIVTGFSLLGSELGKSKNPQANSSQVRGAATPIQQLMGDASGGGGSAGPGQTRSLGSILGRDFDGRSAGASQPQREVVALTAAAAAGSALSAAGGIPFVPPSAGAGGGRGGGLGGILGAFSMENGKLKVNTQTLKREGTKMAINVGSRELAKKTGVNMAGAFSVGENGKIGFNKGVGAGAVAGAAANKVDPRIGSQASNFVAGQVNNSGSKTAARTTEPKRIVAADRMDGSHITKPAFDPSQIKVAPVPTYVPPKGKGG